MSRTLLGLGLALLLAGATGGVHAAATATAIATAQPSTAPALAALKAGAAVTSGAAERPLPAQPKFLPADQVFHVGATAAGADAIRLEWWIRDGYYLYRSRLKVSATTGATLGALQLPAGARIRYRAFDPLGHAGAPPVQLNPDGPQILHLAPFEVRTLESAPYGGSDTGMTQPKP